MSNDRAPVSFKEKALAVTITVICVLFGMVVNAPQKWNAASFITIVTFAAVMTCFKNRWRSKAFWGFVGTIFLIHLALIYLVFAVVLKQVRNVGLLLCLPIIFVETALVYNALIAIERRIDRRRGRVAILDSATTAGA